MTRPLRAALAAAALLLIIPGIALGRHATSTLHARYLVVIVMDGYRPDYMALAPMHNLHALMASGMTYTRAWVGQLETETPTGHATIATGVYPRKHGVIGFVWKDPTLQNITWMPTDTRLINAGDMENLIEGGGVPTLSDLLHSQNPAAKSVAISGEKFYAVDAMGTGADYIVYGDSYGKNYGWIAPVSIGRHIAPARAHLSNLKIHSAADPLTEDRFVARIALRMVATVRPRMLLLNLPGADIEGHRSGGVTAPVAIHNVDTNVDHILYQITSTYRHLGIYNQTLFVVTADHGMLPNGHIVPRQAMYNTVRATGAPLLEMDFLSTAGYVFLRNPSDAPRVASAVVAKHFRWVEGALYKVSVPGGFAFRVEPQTAKQLGPSLTRAYLDLADTFASATSPDVVFPYAEDTLGEIVKGYGPHWGTHGGLSWRVQHIPLIMSGPGVRRGTSYFPAKLADIAPTIERLMGFPIPKGVDGVVLGDALTHPASGDVAHERAVAASRSADVDALKAHSIAQHALVLDNQ
ncbi:MAG TPA: alkaline phosphatase family protein [Chloroflexota bacterium]|nr:alkaline phosphatase family protein [Chloroflexota bacterium]